MRSLIIKIYKFITERKDFIIFSFLKLAVVGLGLISNILIVRKLSIFDYGVYSLVLMIVGFAVTFGFSWSSSSILYYGSKEKAKTGNLNRTFWARNIILFVGLLIINIIFTIFRRNMNSYMGLELSGLILIWIYVRVIEDYMNHYFLAVKKQIISTVMIFTARFIFLVLVIYISFNVKLLVVINILSNLIVCMYMFTINKKDIGKFEFDKDYFKEILSFSLWQLFGFSGLYIINFGDNIVIRYFMTTKDVGIYNAAYKLFNGVAGLSYVISSYYASNISIYVQNKDTNKLKLFFYKERLIIIGISTLLHIGIILCSKQIILFLYGERYLEAISVFNVLMVGSAIRYLGVFYILYYNTNKKYNILQYNNVFCSILNLVLDIILIKNFGLIGPAIATTIAIISTYLYSVYYCEKKIKRLCIVKAETIFKGKEYN